MGKTGSKERATARTDESTNGDLPGQGGRLDRIEGKLAALMAIDERRETSDGLASQVMAASDPVDLPPALQHEALQCLREVLTAGEALTGAIEVFGRLDRLVVVLADEGDDLGPRFRSLSAQSGLDVLNQLLIAIGDELGRSTGSTGPWRFSEAREHALARFPQLARAEASENDTVDSADVVRTRRLEVVDEHDQVRAVLGGQDGGLFGLTILGPGGDKRVWLVCDGVGAHPALLISNGRNIVASIGLKDDSSGSLHLTDSDGQPQVGMTVEDGEGAALVLGDPHGHHVDIGAADDMASVEVTDGEGDVVAALPGTIERRVRMLEERVAMAGDVLGPAASRAAAAGSAGEASTRDTALRKAVDALDH